MKIFFIAGEVSGDHHAAKVIEEITRLHPQAQIEGFGGEAMREEGVMIHRDLEMLAYMGFYEVVKHLPTIKDNFRIAKQRILSWKPDLLVLVDYPGFNLRMAKWAKKEGFKVCYFIAPQVWAWKEKRVLSLAQNTDLLIPILPFEQDYFTNKGITTSYHGHPLAQRIREYIPDQQGVHVRKCIGLFPGSRKDEVVKMLPVMVDMANQLPGFHCILGATSHIPSEVYDSIIGPHDIQVIVDDAYRALAQCDIALTTSGTITLEAALFKVPQVVCYRTSLISYTAGKRLIKVPYISLVNLILGRRLVSELIQDQLNPGQLMSEIQKLLDPKDSGKIQEGYSELEQMLGDENVVEKIAEAILNLIPS